MSGSASAGYPSRAVAWYTVFILMLCYTLSYADRQILAFLVGPLRHDLHINDTDVGLLQGFAFALVYTVFGLPMGALADRFSRRNLVAIGVVIWSVMTSLSSVARSFLLLGAARMGVGIGEAALSPCAFSMITDSFPKERLSGALSVYTMGIQLGSGLALICELLGGALAGGATGRAVSDGRRRVLNSMFSILVDPERLGTAANLAREMEGFVAYATASPPQAGLDRVKTPGEPERAMRAERLQRGIPVDAVTWGEIVAAGAKVGVAAAQVEALARK